VRDCTMVVTGASDGIGAAAARSLSDLGAAVAAAGRSPAKTRAVAGKLRADRYVADFALLDQVRQLARQLTARYPRIDVLINNAGLIATGTRTITGDGHELTFQVNHLPPFLLHPAPRAVDALAGTCDHDRQLGKHKPAGVSGPGRSRSAAALPSAGRLRRASSRANSTFSSLLAGDRPASQLPPCTPA